MNLVKTGILSFLLVSVASTSLARGFGSHSSDKAEWKCTYYNDIEYIQEGIKTFFQETSSSKKKAMMKAKTKCKLNTRRLQKKYNNDYIKSSGCVLYVCKEVK